MGNSPNISILLDIYGNALTKKQQGSLDLFYNQDLSLSEIAEHYNITRQGVHDFIERGRSCLFDLENKIGIVNKLDNIQKNANEIIKIVNSIIDYNKNYYCSAVIYKHALEIIEIANKICDD